MPAAQNLRELHQLHIRAKTIRDLLTSAPKTLAARQAVLAKRREELEKAKKDLKESRAQTKLKETQVQSINVKVDDLRIKLNLIRKQDEYNAIVAQIAADNKSIARLEGEVLEAMLKHDEQAADIAQREEEVAKLTQEVAGLQAEIEARSAEQRAQLAELEVGIADAEAIIPAEQRDQYRRLVKQRGAEAMAAAEGGACSGCYVSVTAQMINELINSQNLVFCMTCGRVLYMIDDERNRLKRVAK